MLADPGWPEEAESLGEVPDAFDETGAAERHQQTSQHRVQAEPAFNEEFVLVAARGQEDGPVLAYAEDLPIIRRYWRTLFGTYPSMSAQAVIPDLRGVRNAVRASMGISVLPAYLCRDDLASGRLVALSKPEIARINTCYLAIRSGGRFVPAIARVHDHLLSHLREGTPYWPSGTVRKIVCDR